MVFAPDAAARSVLFTLTESPALSRGALPRADNLRDSPVTSGGRPRRHLLLLDREGRAPVEPDGHLTLCDLNKLGWTLPGDAIFVGAHDDAEYWAAWADRPEVHSGHNSADQRWADLRDVGDQLSDVDCGIFTTALAMLNWQRLSNRCPQCGARTELARSGWVRRCHRCGEEDFPRTDCAVICLVHDKVGRNGSHVLIGRKHARPAGWASLPAGFVEPGESLEAAVAREVEEETGLSVGEIRYLGSQPWPFPRSLLIAFSATAEAGQVVDVGVAGEFAEARWIHRDTVLAAAASGTAPDLLLPPKTSIARRMLVDWAESGRPGQESW